ncbi:hypothetical protein EsH8_V_001170 [Colletotrichum jinshuiense]
MTIPQPAIPLGSTVVVIGANGFMGVETCEKLLTAGFSVRGTVRNVDKHRNWMHSLFDEKWPGRFSLVRVVDFEEQGAFDEAFRVIFDTDPDKAIDPVIKGLRNTLEAAARAGVQRYVLSSSSKAVESCVYNHPHIIQTDTFNYEAVRKVKENSTGSGFERALSVYSAGRTLAELEFWSWVKQNKPPFVANCVVPDGNFGRILGPDTEGSSVGMLKSAFSGEWKNVIPHLGYYIDVQDSARLLVAALSLSSLENERIFAYRYQGTWNDLRRRVRELYPDRSDVITGDDLEIEGMDLSDATGPIQRAEKVLREVGQQGFTSEDDMLRDFVASVYGDGDS